MLFPVVLLLYNYNRKQYIQKNYATITLPLHRPDTNNIIVKIVHHLLKSDVCVCVCVWVCPHVCLWSNLHVFVCVQSYKEVQGTIVR